MTFVRSNFLQSPYFNLFDVFHLSKDWQIVVVYDKLVLISKPVQDGRVQKVTNVHTIKIKLVDIYPWMWWPAEKKLDAGHHGLHLTNVLKTFLKVH